MQHRQVNIHLKKLYWIFRKTIHVFTSFHTATLPSKSHILTVIDIGARAVRCPGATEGRIEVTIRVGAVTEIIRNSVLTPQTVLKEED